MYNPHYMPYRQHQDQEDTRFFPVLPFLTGLAFGPLLYGAFQGGGYPPYPPAPYYHYPYGYGYNPGPPYYQPYYNPY